MEKDKNKLEKNRNRQVNDNYEAKKPNILLFIVIGISLVLFSIAGMAFYIFAIFKIEEKFNNEEIENEEIVLVSEYENSDKEKNIQNDVSDERVYLNLKNITNKELDEYLERSKGLEIIKNVPSQVSLFTMSYNYLDKVAIAYDEELDLIIDISLEEDFDELSKYVHEYKMINEQNQIIYDAFVEQNYEGYLNADETNKEIKAKWYDLHDYSNNISYLHNELNFIIQDYYEFIDSTDYADYEYDESDYMYYLESIDALLIEMVECSEAYLKTHNELIDIYNI